MKITGKVLVAMSGGVDSSVAAALLHEQGYDLIGVTLHLWDGPEDKIGRCCAPEDREDARRTCDHLGIPHYVLDEREAFRSQVVEPFIESYRNGETPIPCVHCNRTVKLVQLAELAQRFGASHVATGHYAHVREENDGHMGLHRGADHNKDQSYFLFGLPQPTLRKMIFPLGELQKPDVREHGRRLGVPNADKPDSQELCFVPDGNVRSFIEEHDGPSTPGQMVDNNGRLLGEHQGVEGFTVGQRKGLGLSGGSGSKFVLRIVPDTQKVIVGDEASLYDRELNAKDAHWVSGAPNQPFEAQVRIRYRHQAAAAKVTPTARGFLAEFEQPQRAITKGQAAVVYRGHEVIGGGFIA